MTRPQSLLRRILAVALLAGTLAATATQGDAQEVTVHGAASCAAYVGAKRSDSIQEGVRLLTWVLGYVSGLAVASHVDVLGKGDNAEPVLNWLDSYCGAFPARNLKEAADLYYRYRTDQMKGSDPK